MFWHGLVGDSEDHAEQQDLFPIARLESLTLEQVRELTKVLSMDRKRLNQRLEAIQKEIESHAGKLETLRVMGGNTEETVNRLTQLSDLGQTIGHELTKLNDRLKVARGREDLIRKGNA